MRGRLGDRGNLELNRLLLLDKSGYRNDDEVISSPVDLREKSSYNPKVIMNHQELYKLLITVQKNVRCPQCGKPYDFAWIQIRGIVDSIVFLELNCTSHMPLLATVTMSKGTPRIRPIADKVTHDDVIETYKALKKFNGNFEKLFNQSAEKNDRGRSS